MILPRPPATALANETDLYIRSLAFAMDAQLGTVSAIATSPATQYTCDADGIVWVNFPALGQLAGAVIIPCEMNYAAGAIKNMPPVPPASIGRAIPQTPVSLTLQTLNVGSCSLRAMTTVWNNGVYQGQVQQMSAQNALGGTQLWAAGIAWGAKA